MSFSIGFGHTGSAPSPFDALNGSRLAGSDSSHPLHDVRAEELLNPGDGSLSGTITFQGVPRVGEPIRGALELTASKEIRARSAHLRLVGLRLSERRMSETHGSGNTAHTETPPSSALSRSPERSAVRNREPGPRAGEPPGEPGEEWGSRTTPAYGVTVAQFS